EEHMQQVGRPVGGWRQVAHAQQGQFGRRQSGLLEKLAPGGLLRRFSGLDMTAGKGVHPARRFPCPPYEKNARSADEDGGHGFDGFHGARETYSTCPQCCKRRVWCLTETGDAAIKRA